MSDPDQAQPESDEITDIPIEGTVKYSKTSRTMNQKIIQKFAVTITNGRGVKVVSHFPESEADHITVILLKPSHNMKYIFRQILIKIKTLM